MVLDVQVPVDSRTGVTLSMSYEIAALLPTREQCDGKGVATLQLHRQEYGDSYYPT